MKKNVQNKTNNVTGVVNALSQEIMDKLARDYKREQALIRKQLRLKIIMSRTYVSKLIH